MNQREIKFKIRLGNQIAEDNEFCQYTGLHDKNGKEIYEGDILRYATKDFTDGFTDGLKCIVEWVNGGFYAHNHIPLFEILKQDAEIIGNIYENPELL